MANALEIKERQKYLLSSLLRIKKANTHLKMEAIDEEIKRAIVVMEQEDVSYVEKIVGIKAL